MKDNIKNIMKDIYKQLLFFKEVHSLGYYLLDIKIENMMIIHKKLKNFLKNNASVFIDIGGYIKFTNEKGKKIIDRNNYKD